MSHWIDREARRANRNLLIVNGVLLAGAITIFALNAGDVEFRSNLAVIGIGVGILLLCGWNVIKAIRRNGEIQTSPVWKHASVYGDVQQSAYQIEQEQQAGKTKYGKLELTQSWAVRRSLFSTWVSPVQDLAWVYKKITKHSTNGIPTGKTYATVIVGRHKQRIEVQMSQKNTDKLLADLAARVPWAIFGYSKEIEGSWKKDPGGFVAAVDSRRQQITTKASAAK